MALREFGNIYSRVGNPTVVRNLSRKYTGPSLILSQDVFEKRMAALEGCL
jgi:O-acetylhomoserine/O-acetylserine sulfhydrylase-like pyridoxal-dependent enzyme